MRCCGETSSLVAYAVGYIPMHSQPSILVARVDIEPYMMLVTAAFLKIVQIVCGVRVPVNYNVLSVPAQ